MNEWTKYNEILFRLKKEGHFAISTKWMDLEDNYTKWNKSDKDRYPINPVLHRMWKQTRKNSNKNWARACREQIGGRQKHGVRGGRNEWRE